VGGHRGLRGAGRFWPGRWRREITETVTIVTKNGVIHVIDAVILPE